MKKAKSTVLLILAVALTVSSMAVPAYAAKYCPNHPNAKLEEADGSGYVSPYSDIRHKETYAAEYFCSVCHQFVYSDTKYSYGYHEYSSSEGGSCWICGFQRPTKSDLTARAWGVVSDIDQRSGWVLYPGDVYSAAGGGTKVGVVSVNQSMRVIEHANINGVLWCRVCNGIDIQNPIGWISSELLSVDISDIISSEFRYIGHTVRIKVSSGRARSGAGDYPVVEYVHLDETYRVIDQTTGTDGKEWLQIRVDGTKVWISIGLTELYN